MTNNRLLALALVILLGISGQAYGLTQVEYLMVRNTPYLDVRYFGADKTGVADSTTAVVAAIASASANGGIVFFPKGTYKLSGTSAIAVPSTVKMDFNSSTVNCYQSGCPVFDISGSDRNIFSNGLFYNKASATTLLYANLNIRESVFENIRTYDFMFFDHWLGGPANSDFLRFHNIKTSYSIAVATRTLYCIRIFGGPHYGINDCTFEKIAGGVQMATIRLHAHISNCRFENIYKSNLVTDATDTAFLGKNAVIQGSLLAGGMGRGNIFENVALEDFQGNADVIQLVATATSSIWYTNSIMMPSAPFPVNTATGTLTYVNLRGVCVGNEIHCPQIWHASGTNSRIVKYAFGCRDNQLYVAPGLSRYNSLATLIEDAGSNNSINGNWQGELGAPIDPTATTTETIGLTYGFATGTFGYENSTGTLRTTYDYPSTTEYELSFFLLAGGNNGTKTIRFYVATDTANPVECAELTVPAAANSAELAFKVRAFPADIENVYMLTSGTMLASDTAMQRHYTIGTVVSYNNWNISYSIECASASDAPQALYLKLRRVQ